jgi:hypothetical protein
MGLALDRSPKFEGADRLSSLSFEASCCKRNDIGDEDGKENKDPNLSSCACPCSTENM